MQLMPGMTDKQRKAAADSYAQFNQRITGRPMGGQPQAQPQAKPQSSVGGFGQYNPSQGGSQSPWSAYSPPPSRQSFPQQYSPGRAQPTQTPQYGSPYAPQQPRPQQPMEQFLPPSPPPGYGGGYGSNGVRSMDFRDRDGDGVDDRDQPGPGMARPPMAPQRPSWPSPQGPATGPYPRSQPAPRVPAYDPANDPTYRDSFQPMPRQPSPPRRAPKGRDPQAEIDRLKQMGTWDDPRNAKARERLTQQKQDYDTLPAGYFRAPDGSVQEDYAVDVFQGRPAPTKTNLPPQMPRAAMPQSNFQTSVVTPDGSQFSPQQFYPQRDAFIQRLNEERGRQAAQSGVYGPGQAPQFYQPSRDFGALWGQAGDMVRGGWTNPLAGLFG